MDPAANQSGQRGGGYTRSRRCYAVAAGGVPPSARSFRRRDVMVWCRLRQGTRDHALGLEDAHPAERENREPEQHRENRDRDAVGGHRAIPGGGVEERIGHPAVGRTPNQDHH